MKRIHLAVAALLALAPATGFVQAQAQSTGFTAPRLATQDFANGAATASQFAITASQLVLGKSQDLKIRKVAEGIIADYQRGYTRLLEEAARVNIKVPEGFDADYQDRLDKLNNSASNEVDALFTAEVAKEHQFAIALFTEYSKTGDDPRLKRFAAAVLPTLRDHLANVQMASAR